MTPLLSADSVTVQFGDLTAVHDVSMSVTAGEVVGLLGANGAGKTTLIRALLGLLRPVQGTSQLLGGPPDRDHRSRLGYVPQGLGLYADLTVAENLAFVARVYRSPIPPLPRSLVDLSDRLVGSLGLGLQRQLAFVCALLHDPEVLVLDEPTSGVDAVARSGLWDVIHERAAAGVGVLMTTHYMQEAQQCDRLLLMSDGLLVAEGDEAAIVGATTAVEIRTDDWATAFEVLDAHGEPVTLDGRSVRVADGDADALQCVLAARGLTASVRSVPATIEERMTMLVSPQRGVR